MNDHFATGGKMKNIKLEKRLTKLRAQRDELLATCEENAKVNTVCVMNDKLLKKVEQDIAWTERELNSLNGGGSAA